MPQSRNILDKSVCFCFSSTIHIFSQVCLKWGWQAIQSTPPPKSAPDLPQLVFSEKLVVLEIKEEAAETRAEVKTFDHSKLKHVEPQEKNTLPKQSGKCELF